MCGIGRSAIYFCPDEICRGSRNGVSYFESTVNCQCDGKGFIGTRLCAYDGSCFSKTINYYECVLSNVCPKNWTCNGNDFLINLS